MNKLCVVPLLVLAMSCAARAQEESQSSSITEIAAAAPTGKSDADVDASQPTAMRLSAFSTSETAAPVFRHAPGDFGSGKAAEFATPAEPSPATPEPRFVFGGRDDFRWQLGLGISLVRFRSSFFYATGVGTNTSLTYFTNEWLGLEGRITTSFAPTIFLNEHVRYLAYGAGPKIAWRRKKFEPFLHAIVGGAHLVPKIAGEGQNGFEFQAGGGAGYRFNPRLSVRVIVDWMKTRMYGQWQDNAQGALEAVLHF